MGQPTVGTNGAVGALTTSGVATYPATTSVGQLLWLFITSDSATIPNSFTGWTEYGTINTSGSMSSRKFYKYADGTEGGTTFNVTGVTGGTVGFCWIASVNRSASGFMVYPHAVQIGTDTTSNSTAYSATAGTSWQTQASDLIVSFTVHKAAGTLTGNPTGGTITSANSTLGTNAGLFGSRNVSNTAYTSLFSRPVTAGGLGAAGQTFTTVGANVTGHSVFIILREAQAPNDPVGITDSAVAALLANYESSPNDPVGITDTPSQVATADRTQPDTLGITDSAVGQFGTSRLISDAVGLTDSVSADLVGSQANFRAAVDIQGIGSQNTYTFTRPGSVLNDDYGFVVMIAGAGSNAPTAPSGWATLYDGLSAGGGSARLSIYAKRYATGDADPSVVYSTAPGSGNNISGMAFWYSNVPTGQSVSIGSVFTTGTATNTYTAPSKTTTLANRRMIAVSAMKGNGTSFPSTASWSPDATMQATRYATGLFYGSIVVGDWIAASAGATNAQTATWDFSTVQGFGVQIEVPSGTATALDRTQDDPVGITDTLSLTGAYTRALNDPTGISDVVVPVITSDRQPADPVGITDSVSAVLADPVATFRAGVAVEAITTQTDITFTTPGTVQTDDWGTIVMIAGEGSNPPTAPAGWATMYEGLSGGGTARLSIYGKRYAPGDADPTVSYNSAPSTGNNITGIAFWYFNVPVGQTPTLGSVGTSASLTNVYTAPSKTTTTPNRRIVTIGALKGGGSGAPSTGSWSPDASTVASIFASATYYSGIVIGEFMKATAGATNAQTITWDDTRTSGFAVQMEVPSGVVAAYDRTPADPVGITDAVTAGFAFNVAINDAVGIADTDDEQAIDYGDTSDNPVGITDSTTLTRDYVTVAADPVGLTDVAIVTATGDRTQSDPVGITDTATQVTAAVRAPADPVGLTDSVDVLFSGQPATANLNDAVPLSDSLTRTATADRAQSDPVGLTDAVATATAFVVTLADPVGLTDSASPTQSIIESQPDTVGLTDSVSAILTASGQTVDSVGITDAVSTLRTVDTSIGDPVGLTDSLSGIITTGATPADSVPISDTVSAVASDLRTAADSVALTDSAAADLSFPRQASDNVGITDSAAGLIGSTRAPADPVGITDAVTVSIVQSTSLPDFVPVTDAVTVEFIGVGFSLVTDGVGITDGVDYFVWTNKPVNDPVGIGDLVGTGLDRDKWMETDYVGISDALALAADATRGMGDPLAVFETVSVSLDAERPYVDPVGLTDEVSAVLAVGELGEASSAPGIFISDRFSLRLRPYADEVSNT